MKHLHQNVCLNGIFIVKKELKGDRKDSSSSRRQSGLNMGEKQCKISINSMWLELMFFKEKVSMLRNQTINLF